jgi:hypothetical protein
MLALQPVGQWKTILISLTVDERDTDLAENSFTKIFWGYKTQSVIIHSANGGKGEGCLVEEYSAALLC